MCLSTSRIKRTFACHWAGDQIVSPLVSAARPVPGGRKTSLDMDVREFLAIEHGAEIRHFFFETIVDRAPVREREKFFIGRPGSFDWRMTRVIDAFGELRYLPKPHRGRGEWLLPAETLANQGGECEDLAFLLMALLEEAGISRTCLRVVFGQLVETQAGGEPRRHDHTWVMYQLEGGAWMILDPVERVEQHRRAQLSGPPQSAPGAAPASYEYQPFFVLNRDHLWRVHGPNSEKSGGDLDRYLDRRSFWQHYDPRFAMGVHNSIFDDQMPELSASDLFVVKTASLALDANVLGYDPRDHCDFAYVDESWQRIQQRLDSGSVGDLGRACHTVADFYAHTFYAQVAGVVAGQLPLYIPQSAVDPGTRQDAAFDRTKFTINNSNPAMDESQTRACWQGKLISGQWWRWYATYPDDLQTPAQLDPRRCLPDHDVVAVDDECTQANLAHFYSTQAVFNQQFALRKNAAERHVRQIFKDWCDRHRA